MSTPASALSERGFAVLTHARDDRGRESGPVTPQRHRGLSERRLIAAARRGEEAAQEVAQEAFLAAIGALDRFDLGRPLGPWLHRIAVNRAIDLFRARQLRHEVARNTMEEELADGPPPDNLRPLTDQMVGALGEL